MCLSPLPANLAVILIVRGARFTARESSGILMGGLPTTRSHFSDAAPGKIGGTLQLHLDLCTYRSSSDELLGMLLQRVTLGTVIPARSTHFQAAVVGKGQQ